MAAFVRREERRSQSAVTLENRAGGIRTHDLLNPIQAFYQAELRPDRSSEYAQTHAIGHR